MACGGIDAVEAGFTAEAFLVRGANNRCLADSAPLTGFSTGFTSGPIPRLVGALTAGCAAACGFGNTLSLLNTLIDCPTCDDPADGRGGSGLFFCDSYCSALIRVTPMRRLFAKSSKTLNVSASASASTTLTPISFPTGSNWTGCLFGPMMRFRRDSFRKYALFMVWLLFGCSTANLYTTKGAESQANDDPAPSNCVPSTNQS